MIICSLFWRLLSADLGVSGVDAVRGGDVVGVVASGVDEGSDVDVDVDVSPVCARLDVDGDEVEVALALDESGVEDEMRLEMLIFPRAETTSPLGRVGLDVVLLFVPSDIE